MRLSDMGVIARECWREIPHHFHFVRLGAYIVMPNHVHGIVTIDKSGAGGLANGRDVAYNVSTTTTESHDVPDFNHPRHITNHDHMSSISPNPGSLPTIIRSYKSAVTKHIHRTDPRFSWQSRYHEHIIPGPKTYRIIETYIQNNVMHWDRDRFCT